MKKTILFILFLLLTMIITPQSYTERYVRSQISGLKFWLEADDTTNFVKDGNNYISYWFSEDQDKTVSSELIDSKYNGGGTDTTGFWSYWTESSNSISYAVPDSGFFRFGSRVGATPYFYRNISAAVGETYKISYKVKSPTFRSFVYAYIGSSYSSLSTTTVTSEWQTVEVYATARTTDLNLYFQIGGTGITDSVSIKDFSVKKIYGYHLAQRTATNQPQYVDGAVKFATNDIIYIDTIPSTSQPYSIYVLYKTDTTPAVNNYIVSNTTKVGGGLTLVSNVGIRHVSHTGAISIYAGSSVDSMFMPLGSYALAKGIFSGSSSVEQINHGTRTVVNAGTNYLGGLSVGGFWYSGTATCFANISVKLIIVKSGVASLCEDYKIKKYIYDKYGIGSY